MWGGAILVAVTMVAPAARAESMFEFDLRLLDGFAAVGQNRTDGGFVGGIRLGDSTWFGKESAIGMQILVGAEGGALFSHKVDGTLVVGGEVGVQFWGGRGHSTSSGLALSWAPKMFVNLAGGGEVASPIGVELAFDLNIIKFPLWYLHTLDDSNFFGGGLSFVF
jgi:hypothetical protein